MSDFLSRLDELKSKFLENFTHAAALLETRAQSDELEEMTIGLIEMSLIAGLKRSMPQQQLDNSKYDTDAWKHFVGKRSTGGRGNLSSTKRC